MLSNKNQIDPKYEQLAKLFYKRDFMLKVVKTRDWESVSNKSRQKYLSLAKELCTVAFGDNVDRAFNFTESYIKLFDENKNAAAKYAATKLYVQFCEMEDNK